LSIFLNLYLFLNKSPFTPLKIEVNHFENNSCEEKNTSFIEENRTRNKEEIDEAIKYLHVPTWRRSYKRCSDPESEIPCSEVLSAYKALKAYENHILSTPIEKQKFIVSMPMDNGIGNYLSGTPFIALLALMSNRTIVLDTYDIKSLHSDGLFDHPNCVIVGINNIPDTAQQVYSQTGKSISSYMKIFQSNILETLLSDVVIVGAERYYPNPYIYTFQETVDFALPRFGFHAPYFLSNWIDIINQDAIKESLQAFQKFSSKTKVLGVHARSHDLIDSWYMKTEKEYFNELFPFVDNYLKKPNTAVAMASDNDNFNHKMKNRYGDKFTYVNIYRGVDANHPGDLIDFAMLMSCDELVGSYRSTYTNMVHVKSGMKAWVYERESHWIFQLSHSQTSVLSPIAEFHTYFVQLREIYHLKGENGKYSKLFFSHFLI
jgi:hypothetical protein